MFRSHNRLLSCLRFFLILALVILPILASAPAQAAPNILYVSATSANCAGMSPCYATIQSAVDAAVSGDEIRVAAGTYTGAQDRMGANTYQYKQVVFIDKSLAVRGGYNSTTWAGPDPATNPTIIDALSQGRGVTVLGNGSQQVTLEGLIIQGGDYTGLGNASGVSNQACSATGGDCGGGLFVYGAQIILKNSIVRDNIGTTTNTSQGGGILFWDVLPDSRVENIQVTGNSLQGIQGFGGGMLVLFGGAGLTIENSIFSQNQTNGTGAGLVLHQNTGPVLVEDCIISDNIAGEYSGGLYLGVSHDGVAYQIERVTMLGNQAQYEGAAIEMEKWGSDPSTVKFHNILMGDNILTSSENWQGILYIAGGSGAQLDVELKHVTFANHPDKAALHVYQYYNQTVNVDLTNTLISGAYYAFSAYENVGTVSIHHDYTLTNNVNTLHYAIYGEPEFQSTHLVSGDPKLTANYHLGSDSAATDTGVNAGVLDDIDGDIRPIGAGFDIGADEYKGFMYIYIPLVQN